MKTIKVPSLATQILLNLQREGVTSAIIAGGFLRDLYHGKPVKDIDIFINRDDLHNNNDINRLIHTTIPHAYDIVHCAKNKSSAYYTSPHISEVIKVEADYYDIDLIFTTMSPIDYVNRKFDIGLCKVYYNGYVTSCTSDFMNDSLNHTLTVCGEMDRKQFELCNKHHIKRLQLKYPNFSVVYDYKRMGLNPSEIKL